MLPKKPKKPIKGCRTCGLQFSAICEHCQRNPNLFIRDYWISPELVEKLYPNSPLQTWIEFGVKGPVLCGVIVVKIEQKDCIINDVIQIPIF
jgi:hypothetical protein